MTDDFLQPQSQEEFVALYVQHQVAIRSASPAGPDGIAFGPDGNVYTTDGNLVRAYGRSGKEVGKVAIPKDSGTNICFGGIDGCMMYVTTNKALNAGRLEERK